MKLEKGVTVYVRGKVYRDEIPDGLVDLPSESTESVKKVKEKEIDADKSKGTVRNGSEDDT